MHSQDWYNHIPYFFGLKTEFLERLYDTSSNDTSSTEPFRRKGFLSKCHFVECPLRRNRFSSNTLYEIFYAHLVAILYQVFVEYSLRNILCSLGGHIVSADPVTMYHVIVRLRTLAKITGLKLTISFY